MSVEGRCQREEMQHGKEFIFMRETLKQKLFIETKEPSGLTEDDSRKDAEILNNIYVFPNATQVHTHVTHIQHGGSVWWVASPSAAPVTWFPHVPHQGFDFCLHCLPNHRVLLITSTTARLVKVSHLKAQNILTRDLEWSRETSHPRTW